MAQAFRDSNGDPAITGDLLKQIRDPSFQALSTEAKTSKLHEFVLLHSPAFKALPSSKQAVITDAFANGNQAAIRSLIGSAAFNDPSLSTEEQTAILSQVANYPDPKAIQNFERLLAKDWYQGMSLEDKQRTLKTIGNMSTTTTGDRTILDNTLNRLLDPASDYRLQWQAKSPDSHGNIYFGWNPHGSHDVYLNSNLLTADNEPIDSAKDPSGAHLGLNTLNHEISHAINDDKTDQTFDYLNEEYRAWYVGYQAEHGHPPSNQEALERWEYFLNPNGGYAEYSHGIERRFWWDTDGALDKPEEAAKIYQMLSDLTGLSVNADNYKDVLASDPSTWSTEPNGDAATRWPSGDDLDN